MLISSNYGNLISIITQFPVLYQSYVPINTIEQSELELRSFQIGITRMNILKFDYY